MAHTEVSEINPTLRQENTLIENSCHSLQARRVSGECLGKRQGGCEGSLVEKDSGHSPFCADKLDLDERNNAVQRGIVSQQQLSVH